MKNNNKGFMLAEVVITSTIVLTSLISLYVTFNKLYKNYEIRSRYYDIDGYYAIKEIINLLIKKNEISDVLPGEDNYYKEISTLTSLSNIKGPYQIQDIYVTKYDKKSLENLGKNVPTNTFKDYINYLIKYYNFNDNKYTYLFITEYKNDGDYYYANIGLG